MPDTQGCSLCARVLDPLQSMHLPGALLRVEGDRKPLERKKTHIRVKKWLFTVSLCSFYLLPLFLIFFSCRQLVVQNDNERGFNAALDNCFYTGPSAQKHAGRGQVTENNLEA
ncbi:hypothetical protein KIL84_000703 [Mauremys mutica]|uniref:Uncharacterized protein n=1 Tax=Mauremys mutica TaxID=74926 RepID=A0A9D3WYM6_9SAUR|nr:hypothetical protein KIL84_000703 [Mauremys mutica]